MRGKHQTYTGPRWSAFYDLGVQLNGIMPKLHSIPETAARFQISSDQNAYVETVVALGKLAYHARRELAKAIKNREEI